MSAPADVVHEMPPTGGRYTRCCLALPADLPEADLYSRDPGRITCTAARRIAEMPVDTDRGESPFGWSDPT
ncbi:hypothetical protein ACFY64_31560 [Streptomyces collinus]|uniref:hypothetical protein n=1 Tax=Streptomyces collinus TaxID=42684 RepID=UPI00368C55CF